MRCECLSQICVDVISCNGNIREIKLEAFNKKEKEKRQAEEKDKRQALELVYILRPCLKVNSNGRFDTVIGDKTAIGLVEVIKRIFNKGYNLKEEVKEKQVKIELSVRAVQEIISSLDRMKDVIYCSEECEQDVQFYTDLISYLEEVKT